MTHATHNLVQRGAEWLTHRLSHDNASEAAAVLGLSRTTTRTELLHMKHTGLGKEFSDWVQRNVLDYGHEVEEKVRPLIEVVIGEVLYPVTCSDGRLSASLDGLTMSEEIAFECKQWNAEIAAQVAAGIMPEQHMPQCQQILMVTGAEKVIFAVGDGTPENLLTLDVLPDSAWFERIRAGWAQFHEDLAAYVPTEKTVTPIGAAITALPAVSVQVTGSIAIKDNFKAFEVALKDFIEHRLIRKPETDQDFADLDTQIKALKGAESALDALEAQMLSQVEAVDMAKRTKDMLLKMARENRLMAEKLLAARKDQIKVEQVQRGQKALVEHITSLNQRLGKLYMPMVHADFGGAVKGKRTVASLQDAVDTELARAKIDASATADKIGMNLATLRELAAAHAFLFADTAQIVLKANDDLTVLVKSRIAEHEQKEAARIEAETARIRAEVEQQERAKAEQAVRVQAEAAAKVQREAEVAERARLAEESRVKAETAAAELKAAQALPDGAELLPLAQALNEQEGAQRFTAVHPLASTSAPNMVAMPVRTAAPADTGATMKLGEVNARLTPIALTAEGLASLGFTPVATDKNAKLYRVADLGLICAALLKHIGQVQAKLAA